MRQLSCPTILLLAACGGASGERAAPPAPSTSGIASSSRETASASAASASASPPPAPPPSAASTPLYAPPAPFAIVARAPKVLELSVLTSSDGDAWILATERGAKKWSGARWARARGAVVEALPARNEGLPSRPTAIASRGDVAWLAVERPSRSGAPSCEVFEWSERAWISRGRPGHVEGPCSHLVPWTSGVAIAALGRGETIELATIGAAPPHALAFADPPRGGGRLAQLATLRAWDDGTVVAVGLRAAPTPAVTIHRWSGRSSRAITGEVPIDYNAPFVASAPSKDDVWVDGIGVVDAEPEGVRYASRFRGGQHTRLSTTKHELCDLEMMLVSGPSLVGVADREEIESFVIEGEDIYAVVTPRTGGETFVVRDRPVDRSVAFAP